MLYKEIEQIVSTTHDTINKLLEYSNWPDALALYFRYIQQSKMQNNKQTFSNNNFMQKAMWWWKQRFQKAKSILIDNGLIQIVQQRDGLWKVIKRYVKVNFVIQEPRGRLNQTVDEPDGGETETNTLVVKGNTLVVKKNKKIKKENFSQDSKSIKKENWLSIEKYVESRNKINKIWDRKWFKYCKKITPDIRNEWNKIKKKYSDEDIVEWTNNYAKEIKSRNKDSWSYFEHRYSLYEFLKQWNALVRYINQ